MVLGSSVYDAPCITLIDTQKEALISSVIPS